MNVCKIVSAYGPYGDRKHLWVGLGEDSTFNSDTVRISWGI